MVSPAFFHPGLDHRPHAPPRCIRLLSALSQPVATPHPLLTISPPHISPLILPAPPLSVAPHSPSPPIPPHPCILDSPIMSETLGGAAVLLKNYMFFKMDYFHDLSQSVDCLLEKSVLLDHKFNSLETTLDSSLISRLDDGLAQWNQFVTSLVLMKISNTSPLFPN